MVLFLWYIHPEMSKQRRLPKRVETLTHDEASRKNIPTAEYQPVMPEGDGTPIQIAYDRRNRDLDPQLVWRGKDVKDWSDLVVPAPPLFIQEKVHPKVLIDDLVRQTRESSTNESDEQPNLFADFNGLPEGDAKTEFYEHDANWSNRMILGDSLQVMASLAEREGLRGKVQCIYVDPPYGIKFNSNFQWSTTSRDVRDGKAEHITREPEQVKAFRDTWRDGIHSYLTYLRDRLTVARELLTESGSIFVQIGDENVHRVRALMDEVFGEENMIAVICYASSIGLGSAYLDTVTNHIIWYCRDKNNAKRRNCFGRLTRGARGATRYNYIAESHFEDRPLSLEERDGRISVEDEKCYFRQGLTSRTGSRTTRFGLDFEDQQWHPTVGGWRTGVVGMDRVLKANRIAREGKRLTFKKYFGDFGYISLTNFWSDLTGGVASRSDPKIFVVQTSTRIVQRCLLMATDPGDLVLDPTCGSGTTAYVAEQWGRRWITIDTSRVALALARARVMGARYPYYMLADSREGMEKEAQLARSQLDEGKVTYGDIRQGFVYKRVPHITLKSIANNAEIDEIWEEHRPGLDRLRARINEVRGEAWEEWEIPRHAEAPWEKQAVALFTRLKKEQHKKKANAASVRRLLDELNAALGRSYTLDSLPERPADPWPEKEHEVLHADWWKGRIARQKEIDVAIAAQADYEYLYDKPYEDKRKVRVSGPFTVESLSPSGTWRGRERRSYGSSDRAEARLQSRGGGGGFVSIVLDNLRTAGVQQAHKEDKIAFSSLTAWPGKLVCAEGRFVKEGGRSRTEQRAAIFVGPEFGTVVRPDLAAAAREAAEAGFDVLVACGFNYGPHAMEFNKLGRISVLKARMNADLHMADDLKNTGKGNLFVVFGEPDIEILPVGDGAPDDDRIRVKLHGVDVFHPGSGEVRSDGPDGIACWFIDTDYDEESFFVRHAYFLGAGDPYKALKTTLKAEIDAEAWATLRSDTSRPFDRPKSGRIAVKVINHLGDEVMKVFRA